MDASALDISRELANMGLGEAANALSKLMNKRVVIKLPNVITMKKTDATSLFESIKEPAISAVTQKFSGTFNGEGLLFFPESSAHALLEAFADGRRAEEYSTEESVGVFEEIGNILIGSFMLEIGKMAGARVFFEVPKAQIRISSDEVINQSPDWETTVLYENEMVIQNSRIRGYLFIIFKRDGYYRIIKKLQNANQVI